MKITVPKRQPSRILNACVLALALLVANTCHSSATAQEVAAYIEQNGGCSIVGNSWEREFQRRDDVRYGKAFKDWSGRDFQDLESWIVHCLDPWIDVPGRREVYMRNVDERLRSYYQTHTHQNAAVAHREANEAFWREQRQRIANIDGQYRSQAEIARVASLSFDQAAAAYLATFKLGLNLSNLDAYEADGKKVASLLAEAEQAISVTRSIAEVLNKKGGPLRYIDDPKQVRAFGERMKRIAMLKATKERCLAILEQAGIPRDFASTPVFIGRGADDPFFFEGVCPATSDTLQLIKPGLLSDLFKLNVGRVVTTTLWFELRQKAEKPGSSNTESRRLVLKRLRTKTADLSANSDWEASNMLSGALAMMDLR